MARGIWGQDLIDEILAVIVRQRLWRSYYLVEVGVHELIDKVYISEAGQHGRRQDVPQRNNVLVLYVAEEPDLPDQAAGVRGVVEGAADLLDRDVLAGQNVAGRAAAPAPSSHTSCRVEILHNKRRLQATEDGRTRRCRTRPCPAVCAGRTSRGTRTRSRTPAPARPLSCRPLTHPHRPAPAAPAPAHHEVVECGIGGVNLGAGGGGGGGGGQGPGRRGRLHARQRSWRGRGGRRPARPSMRARPRWLTGAMAWPAAGAGAGASRPARRRGGGRRGAGARWGARGRGGAVHGGSGGRAPSLGRAGGAGAGGRGRAGARGRVPGPRRQGLPPSRGTIHVVTLFVFFRFLFSHWPRVPASVRSAPCPRRRGLPPGVLNVVTFLPSHQPGWLEQM